MTSFGISLLGYPFTFLVRAGSTIRRSSNSSIEVRTKFGNKTIDKLSAARSMLKMLRSGEHALGLLTDLNTLDDEAIFVDFFGVPAATTFVVAKLAVRTNTPLVPVFAPWSEEKGKYLLIAEPPIPPECTGDEEADVRRVDDRDDASASRTGSGSFQGNGCGFTNAGRRARPGSRRFINHGLHG